MTCLSDPHPAIPDNPSLNQVRDLTPLILILNLVVLAEKMNSQTAGGPYNRRKR
jgi:hypothetical protein